jgi:hypothetical protein
MNRTEYLDAYMDSESENYKLFRLYYGQFVNERIKKFILNRFTEARLKAVYKQDKHFNNISLECWDSLAPYIRTLVDMPTLKLTGEGWSLSTAVCIAKTAAEEIALTE